MLRYKLSELMTFGSHRSCFFLVAYKTGHLLAAAGLRGAIQRVFSRWAGAVYLLVVVTGIFSLGYVPGQLRMSGRPQAMLGNLVVHQRLFQAGIAAFIVEQVAFALLPLMLLCLLSNQELWCWPERHWLLANNYGQR